MSEIDTENPQTSLSENEIRGYLEKEGCVIHEKKELELPEVDRGKMELIFGEGSKQATDVLLPHFDTFLSKVPITDNFGEDHDARRTWRESLPADVRNYYENRNQIKKTSFKVIMTMEALAYSARENGGELASVVSDKIQAIYDKKMEKINSFLEMTIEERIAFAREVEQSIVEILKLFS